MCSLVDVQFAGQQIGVSTSSDSGCDRQRAGLGRIGQDNFEFVAALFGGIELLATHVKLDLRFGDRAVVRGAIQLQNDLFAVEHANEFEQVRYGGESW